MWTRRFRGSSPEWVPIFYEVRSTAQVWAYPSLHPFGVVHWVPVLSNIKTATGCESNRQLQLWTVFAGTVVNNYQFNGIQGWAVSNKMPGCHLANAWRSRSKHILQWRYSTAMKYQFIHSFIIMVGKISRTRGWTRQA